MRQHFKGMVLAMGLASFATGSWAMPGVYKTHMNKSVSISKENSWLVEHLVGFKAEYSSRSVDLHWNLSATGMSGHFNIERSFDGEHFEKIGEVNTRNSALARYDFTDNVKPAVIRKNDLYYRLQQVDGENSSYSKVLIVRMYETHSVASISVTPDPTVNDIQVNVQLKESSYVVIKVTDNNGEELMRKNEKAGEGTNSYSLEGTNKLKPGSYKLEIIVNSNERMTMQLIKS